MAGRRVRCPECTVILDIPEGFRGTKVRCSVCNTQFRIPGVSDADILDWIGEEEAEDTAHGTAALSASRKPTMVPSRDRVETSAPKTFEGFPTGVEGFTLVRVDAHGALFEFPAEMLEPTTFRTALPRKCLRCGTENHITPRVVIFGPVLQDSTIQEAEFLNSSTKFDEHEARNLSTEEVLQRLDKLENLPHPADLPMVYWVCDLCSPSKLISAQNRIDPNTRQGSCCLQIHRIWRALDFLRVVGDEDSDAYDKLLSVIEKHPETPWEQLPGALQQRMRQWFAPHRGEKFVAYCPDRTHSRTEDGMAGIIVTTRRLIYRTALRRQESEKGEPLELSFTVESGRQVLNIEGSNWDIKELPVDKTGLRALRLALAEQRFNAQWH
ncbi:MAG: hypothetical protein JXA11_07290 [Phycisphaerae bacterium]|nr:hypothetical protein [Phycisphaerae bacterium]